jgi:hypothetical protein
MYNYLLIDNYSNKPNIIYSKINICYNHADIKGSLNYVLVCKIWLILLTILERSVY